MVISPALGSYTMDVYGQNFPVALATAIAILDVFFILVAVPESLPEKARPPVPISWEQADPFAALGKVRNNFMKSSLKNVCFSVFQLFRNDFFDKSHKILRYYKIIINFDEFSKIFKRFRVDFIEKFVKIL